MEIPTQMAEEILDNEDLMKLAKAIELVESIHSFNVLYPKIVMEDVLLEQTGYTEDFDTHQLRKIR